MIGGLGSIGSACLEAFRRLAALRGWVTITEARRQGCFGSRGAGWDV